MTAAIGQLIGSEAELRENQLLEWFASLKLPLVEKQFRFGDLQYFNFSSYDRSSTHGLISSHGRSTSRRLAAIKCAAEMIERKFMLDFFAKRPIDLPNVERYDFSKGSFSPSSAAVPSSDLFSSNGWAIHFEKPSAMKRAVSESLERHLLLTAYIEGGWQGFVYHDCIESVDLKAHLYISCRRHHGQAAGFVVARSPLYKGASFGYCIGNESDLSSFEFWENGLYEAVDKIMMLSGKKIDLTLDPNSWIASETKKYLEEDFDVNLLTSRTGGQCIEDHSEYAFVAGFDLQQHYNLPFPLFAAWSWGGDLTPLFYQARLADTTARKITEVLKRVHRIDKSLPRRHPIL